MVVVAFQGTGLYKTRDLHVNGKYQITFDRRNVRKYQFRNQKKLRLLFLKGKDIGKYLELLL